MAGRHRAGKHSEKTVKAKEFFPVLPVKPPTGSIPVKGHKVTQSDVDASPDSRPIKS